MKKPIYIIIFLIMFLTVSLVITGCSKKNPLAQKPQDPIGQKPKAPPAAQQILKDLDKIITALDQKIKTQNMSGLEQKTQIQPSNQQGQTASGNDQGNNQQFSQPGNKENGQKSSESQNQGSGQQSSSQSNQSDSQQSPGKVNNSGSTSSNQQNNATGTSATGNSFDQEETSLKSIHNNWNTLEPEAVQAGLSTAARNSFETSLDDLTRRVYEKNSEESLLAAISLYQSYSELARVFSMPIPPDFFQLKYEAMSATVEAGRMQWAASMDHIPYIQEHWNNLKVQLSALDPKLLNRADFSITDLISAIQSKQKELVAVKDEIVMTNLQTIENKLTKGTGGIQSTGGGQ